MKFVLISLLILSNFAYAKKYSIGTGMSSVTQGRIVPLLDIGFDNKKEQFRLNSIGVQNEVYYHSSYKLSYYRKLPWPFYNDEKIIFGYGLGALYSKRGYKASKSASIKHREDWLVGANFRFQFDFFKNFYFALDSFYATKTTGGLFLSFQNENTLSLGVKF